MKRLLLVAATLLAAASPAAAKPHGTTTFEVRGTSVALPVTSGEVRENGATLRHVRPLVLRGKRLTAVRVVLARGGATVSASLRGARTTFFTAAGTPAVDRVEQTAALASAPLMLTAKGAEALGMRAGRAGRFSTSATLHGAEPPPLARPAGAVDVTGATVTWHVRDSFVRYVNSGEGIVPSRGATAEPPATTAESDTPLAYDFHFPFRAGWYDAATQTGRLTFGGRVTFRYTGHGIDLDVNDLEVELRGDRSRAIARFTGRRDTRPGNRRGVLVALDATGGLERMPGTIPRDTAGAIFAGYYLAGDPFGWIGVAFATR